MCPLFVERSTAAIPPPHFVLGGSDCIVEVVYVVAGLPVSSIILVPVEVLWWQSVQGGIRAFGLPEDQLCLYTPPGAPEVPRYHNCPHGSTAFLLTAVRSIIMAIG